MEFAILVTVAAAVWLGVTILHALTDALDGCSCAGLLLAGLGIAVVIIFCLGAGWG